MRKALLIFFGAVIVIGIVLYFIHQHAEHTFGTSYDPSNSHDLEKIIVIGDNSRPLREALERFRHDHGCYPIEASNLFSGYLKRTNAPDDVSFWAGWNVDDLSTNHYLLVYKVGWDD